MKVKIKVLAFMVVFLSTELANAQSAPAMRIGGKAFHRAVSDAFNSQRPTEIAILKSSKPITDEKIIEKYLKSFENERKDIIFYLAGIAKKESDNAAINKKIQTLKSLHNKYAPRIDVIKDGAAGIMGGGSLEITKIEGELITAKSGRSVCVFDGFKSESAKVGAYIRCDEVVVIEEKSSIYRIMPLAIQNAESVTELYGWESSKSKKKISGK